MKMVSDELLEEFRVIILEDYGREITKEEASEIANGMVQYFDLLAKMKHEQDQANKEKSEKGA